LRLFERAYGGGVRSAGIAGRRRSRKSLDWRARSVRVAAPGSRSRRIEKGPDTFSQASPFEGKVTMLQRDDVLTNGRRSSTIKTWEAWLAFVLSLPSPFVVVFWLCVIADHSIMNERDLYPLYFVVCHRLAPITGIGAFFCTKLYFGRPLLPWYIWLCLAASTVAFIFDFICFACLIAQGV
jgi:hypothetical protein